MKDRVRRLFREKRIEDISTPEKNDDYICLISPGTGFLAAALIFLAAGAIYWFCFGA